MSESATPLDTFFASYPGFSYNPDASATGEFKRMGDQFSWGKKRREEERERFRRAMVIQFNNTFGTDESSLRSWQSLCEAIDMSTIPDTLEECQKAVAQAHVNLVDLLDAAMRGERTRRFPSEKALSKYTKKTKKFFPLERAKAGGLLRFLLRQIRRPRRGRQATASHD